MKDEEEGDAITRSQTDEQEHNSTYAYPHLKHVYLSLSITHERGGNVRMKKHSILDYSKCAQ